MTTPERDVAAIRERHVPVTLPKGDDRERTRWQGCDFDEQPWPCDVAVLLAATPSAEPQPPYRRDLAETLCFLDHRHDEPSCPKGRHEADRIYRALEARYAHRAAACPDCGHRSHTQMGCFAALPDKSECRCRVPGLRPSVEPAGLRDHETCVPHDHVEPDMTRWERDQAAALAALLPTQASDSKEKPT